MPTPPCHRSKNRSFTHPTAKDSAANRAAIKICEHCPIRKQCAADALTAGDTLDSGYSAPAQGVIQAGVVCRGDITTAIELSLIAEIAMPDYNERARIKASAQCKHCERPMVPWTRGEVPEGYVMHRGRNYCTDCRAAYSAELAAEKRRPTLSKDIDRRNHHSVNMPAPRKNTPAAPQADQLSLFG